MKKPFFKRVSTYVIGVIVLLGAGVLLMPYGLNQRSVGAQLADTTRQFVELNVYDEKDSWDEGEWEEHFEEHPEFSGYVHEDQDWEVTRTLPDDDDPRFDQPPHDYEALWGVDFHDLEVKDRYDVRFSEVIEDDQGSALEERYIYRERSTGSLVADVSLDGFILRLDPSYKLGWNSHQKDDANGHFKYRKAINLEIEKELGDVNCGVNIAPYDRTGSLKNETIDHPRYKLVMRNDDFGTEEKPKRFLLVSFDNPPFDIEHYSIEIDYGEPKACFEANLEMEVLDGMTFMNPVLEEMPLIHDPDRFPIPRDWPHPDESEFLTIERVDGKKSLKHKELGIQVELNSGWEIKTDSKNSDSIEIIKDRRCKINLENLGSIKISDWIKDLEEGYKHSFGGYHVSTGVYEIQNFSATSVTINHSDSDEYDTISNPEDTTQLILFKSGDKILSMRKILKNLFSRPDVPEGHCEDFYKQVENNLKILTN